MLQTEYVRNLHCNYERLLLDRKPEDTRYQYCILSRGGIKGLLPCSLRYIDGSAYLYYDISSKQSIVQLFENRVITREWLRDFMWSYRQIQQELDRFLLDEHNVIWYPEQVFLDLDNRVFSFMYIPYYQQESGFGKLVDFWVEHIDYEDEALVGFVYRVYDQLEKNGDAYLQGQIFEDAAALERKAEEKPEPTETPDAVNIAAVEKEPRQTDGDRVQKKKLFGIFEGKKKNREVREDYRRTMQEAMYGYAVAEDTVYECRGRETESQGTEYGRTVYVEETPDAAKLIHRIYSSQGQLLADLDKDIFSIGKKKEEVDLVLEDMSVSRMHARIVKQGTEIYLEDLNSTNGTFKNGLRLQPYEKRKLETEDEIKFGNMTVIFR
ncbi:MAG: FHA domain-containing protein [Blautia sp.]|nr:FHA domain-containing protein [Blautia sp.]